MHKLISRGVYGSLIALTIGVLCGRISSADDVSGKFGFTGLVGAGLPLAPHNLTSAADSAGLNLGGKISLPIGSQLGIGISYENMYLGNGMRVAPFDVLFLMRFMPESRWTPTAQLGGGVARTTTTKRYENSSFNAGVGLDYFVEPDWAVGPQVVYHYLSHSGGASPMHGQVLELNAAITYFFGSTQGGH
jgi:hypothetical protein